MQLTQKALRGPPLRRILNSRRGAVLVAFLCALAAAVILIFALGQYRQSVAVSNRQDTVLVASALIQKGTSGDAIASGQLFRATPVLASHVSVGALSDAGSLRGLVAAHDILPGQQLTASDFAGGGGFAAELAPNQRAVSVSLDGAHGLTDVVQAGNRVDVYGSFTVQATGVTQPVQVVRLLVGDALVLKSPIAAGSAIGSTGQAGTVLLEVGDSVAPTIAYASDNGKVWLVLRPANAATPNQDLTTIDSVLLGVRIRPDFKSALSLTGGH